MNAQSLRSDRGLTMIELLVVMAILSVLGGLAALTLPSMLRQGKVKAVELSITALDAAIKAYAEERSNGDYPPTLLQRDDFPGVGNPTPENCGVESVLLCLNRRGKPSRYNVEEQKELRLMNLDEDRTEAVLTSFGDDVRDLYELVDPWGTPLAYFHSRDYAKVEGSDLGRISGFDQGSEKAKPWRNEKMRGYFNRETFQIISAGPDRVFNTEDDITNFSKE